MWTGFGTVACASFQPCRRLLASPRDFFLAHGRVGLTQRRKGRKGKDLYNVERMEKFGCPAFAPAPLGGELIRPAGVAPWAMSHPG